MTTSYAYDLIIEFGLAVFYQLDIELSQLSVAYLVRNGFAYVFYPSI